MVKRQQSIYKMTITTFYQHFSLKKIKGMFIRPLSFLYLEYKQNLPHNPLAMNDKYKLLRANPQVCKRLFGVDFVQLEEVLAKVQNRIAHYLEENPLSNRGLDAEFSIANQLLLTFEYLRQYPTFLSLGFSYGISESYCNKIFHKMRVVLAEVVGLKNPEKLTYKDVKTVIVDVTVQPIERPQKDQKHYYNGSKKSMLLSHN